MFFRCFLFIKKFFLSRDSILYKNLLTTSLCINTTRGCLHACIVSTFLFREKTRVVMVVMTSIRLFKAFFWYNSRIYVQEKTKQDAMHCSKTALKRFILSRVRENWKAVGVDSASVKFCSQILWKPKSRTAHWQVPIQVWKYEKWFL